MRRVVQTVTGVANSPAIPMDHRAQFFNVGIEVTVSATATYNVQFTIDDVYSSAVIGAPVQSALSTVTTGGTLAAATYFYVVTALNQNGETIKSNEQSITTTGTTSTNTVTWTAVPGATGYKIYRGTSAGAENVFYTVAAVTTFSDTGAANTGGTPPTTNTALAITWFNVASPFTGATANQIGNLTIPCSAMRLNVTASTGSVTLTLLQSSGQG